MTGITNVSWIEDKKQRHSVNRPRQTQTCIFIIGILVVCGVAWRQQGFLLDGRRQCHGRDRGTLQMVAGDKGLHARMLRKTQHVKRGFFICTNKPTARAFIFTDDDHIAFLCTFHDRSSSWPGDNLSPSIWLPANYISATCHDLSLQSTNNEVWWWRTSRYKQWYNTVVPNFSMHWMFPCFCCCCCCCFFLRSLEGASSSAARKRP